MHSPPTIVRHIVRPKSAEPPRSPLLKRVQSEEKLSPSYGSDKKHLCSRKHSLEVTQEEVQREQSQREVTLQSLEENMCDAPALSRARPVEQGCLKRPVSRKLGRQESVDELDRDKLKTKVVVKKPDGFPEKQEPHQKSHGLGSDLENHSTLRLEEREKKKYPKSLERSAHFENKAAVPETQSLGSLLKDALHKQASVRASEAVTLDGAAAACGQAPGDHNQGTCDFKRASAPSPVQDGLCHPTDRSAPGKGDHMEKAPQAKECLRCDKLDSKLANIDYLRKKMSLEDKDENLCPVLKPKMTSTAHECLPGNPAWPVGGQQETPPASESRAFMSSAHTTQMSGVTFVPLKALAARVDGGAEKPGLIAPESPVRKSPSEYKLEGRSVSCLKPIEGTLDIALLSGPQASKTEPPSPVPAQSPSPGSDVRLSAPPALPSSGGKKADAAVQREPSPAGFKVSKSYLLEPRFPPPSRGLQSSPAAHLPDPELKQDRRVSHATRSPVTVTENNPQRREGGPSKHQDPSPDTKHLLLPGQNLQSPDPPRACGPLPTRGVPLREKLSGRESSERGPSTARIEPPAARADIHRDPSMELCPPEATTTSDNSKNPPSVGRTRPDLHTQTQAVERAWGPSGKANHRDGHEARPLAREDSLLRSGGTPCERQPGMGRGGVEAKLEASPATRSLQPPESGKSEKLCSFSSLQKDGPKEPERKEQLQQHLSSGSQPPAITKELPGPDTRQLCGSPSHSLGREPGSKPCVPEPSLGLQDPPKPTAVHSESSSHKPRPGPEPSPLKSKPPDKPLSSQKPSVGAAIVREPGMQPSGGPSREGKASSKAVLDVFPAPLGSQATASNVTGAGGSGPPVSVPLKGGPLDTKPKPTDVGRAPGMLEKPVHLPRQGHPGASEPVEQKLATVGEKLTLSPKHPKPSTVKDGPPPCRQTDKSPGPLAAGADRKSEGKRCTEALYAPAESGKAEASLAPAPAQAQGEARPKGGAERPAAAAGKGLPEAKSRAPGPQKPLAEAGRPGGMKRSPSAVGQGAFRSAAAPEKSLSSSCSFPEARPGVREASAASGDPFSAKANGAAPEPAAAGHRDHRKPLPAAGGAAHMTKSDSLPSFRSPAGALEPHPPGPGAAGARDRALSVSASASACVCGGAGEAKGREPAPAQPPAARKPSAGAGREAAKPCPAPSSERPIALSSEKDFVVRQRRGKESVRSSPHKKAS